MRMGMRMRPKAWNSLLLGAMKSRNRYYTWSESIGWVDGEVKVSTRVGQFGNGSIAGLHVITSLWHCRAYCYNDLTVSKPEQSPTWHLECVPKKTETKSKHTSKHRNTALLDVWIDVFVEDSLRIHNTLVKVQLRSKNGITLVTWISSHKQLEKIWSVPLTPPLCLCRIPWWCKWW